MSNAFAIGAVSAVLKNLLENMFVTSAVGTVNVSVIAPDQVKAANNDLTRLNLFLYHVEPNAGWRNVGMPSRDGTGQRITNAPLGLDLFYLLTAYGKDEFEAEILLGHAAQLLHEVPVLTRDSIRATFTTLIAGTTLSKLASSELSEQIEQIRITPHVMNTEEMSKLWSALASNYRPSIAYQMSVVLIEATRPARSPLPVLTRAPSAFPHLFPPFPTLTAARPPNQQPAIRLGEMLTLEGHDLGDGPVAVLFEHARLSAPLTITPLSDAVTPAEIRVIIPDHPADWPAGSYTVSVTVTSGGKTNVSNSLPVAIAPQMGISLGTVDATGARADGKLTITLHNIKPEVLPLQKASLVVSDREAAALPHATKTNELTFTFDPQTALPAGEYLARLRVDGVESLLIRRDVKPPQFDPTQTLKITA